MDTQAPLISVVVPVYNVADYLQECVESICAQTYTNLEIILVDDGSTDCSGELCDELSSIDERIAVFHKQNGGLSDARNFGLAHSRGAWISFIDSDDYVSPVFIEALFNAAYACHCKIAAVSGGHSFRDGTCCTLVEALESLTPAKLVCEKEVQLRMLYQQLATGAPWRLYERETLGQRPFPVGLYYEDLASTYKFIHAAGNVAVINCRELYAYRLRATSIIRQDYSHIKGSSALIVAAQLEKDITAWYPDLSTAVASRCFAVCRMVYAQIPVKGADNSTVETERDGVALWSVIKRHRKTVLLDACARKRERLAALAACFGRSCFSYFCYICRRLGKMQ